MISFAMSAPFLRPDFYHELYQSGYSFKFRYRQNFSPPPAVFTWCGSENPVRKENENMATMHEVDFKWWSAPRKLDQF